MKRPSDWPLHFVLYPIIFRIYPGPILAIIQEILKLNRRYLHPYQNNYCINSIFLQEDYPTNCTEIIDAAFFSTPLRMNPARSQA